MESHSSMILGMVVTCCIVATETCEMMPCSSVATCISFSNSPDMSYTAPQTVGHSTWQMHSDRYGKTGQVTATIPRLHRLQQSPPINTKVHVYKLPSELFSPNKQSK